MSEFRVPSLRLAGAHLGSSFISTLLVALLTSGLGLTLMTLAHWNASSIIASMIAFAIVGTIVNIAWVHHMGSHLGDSHLGSMRFGEANQATLLRSGLVCLIAGALLASGHAPAPGWALCALITIALLLDAVDGFLARRYHLTSSFGARFDIEIDAMLIMILSVLVLQTGRVGSWVLAIGLLRYLFVLASFAFPFMRASLPHSFRRKAICALQGVALLTCLLPPMTVVLSSLISAFALGALMVSFALDIAWLFGRTDRSGGMLKATSS